MIAGQKLALGRAHAHTVVTAHVAEHTITVELDDGGRRTFRRTTTHPVRSLESPTTPQHLSLLARTSSNRQTGVGQLRHETATTGSCR